jgi:hypothetical protein
MGHLLKIKCVDSRVNAHFSFNKCPIYTHDGASAEFSTNSHETDNSVGCCQSFVNFHSSVPLRRVAGTREERGLEKKKSLRVWIFSVYLVRFRRGIERLRERTRFAFDIYLVKENLA